MHKIQTTIDIKASVQRVYDFILAPRHLPGVWHSLLEVSHVVTRPGPVYDYDFVYKMAGVHMKGHTTTEEAQPGRLLRTRSEGAILSTFRWTFQGLDGAGTRLTCDVEYAIPTPVIGKIAEAISVKLNRREAETTLANIKDVMEHSTATVAAGAPAH